MHLRRGLHPHRYHLHARRAPLLKMRATTELIGPARRIPSTRSAACRVLTDEGVLPGCFYLATLEDASWLSCYMTRTRTGALPGHVPSAAMDDGSVEDASELRLGGYAVLEGEASSYGART